MDGQRSMLWAFLCLRALVFGFFNGNQTGTPPMLCCFEKGEGIMSLWPFGGIFGFNFLGDSRLSSRPAKSYAFRRGVIYTTSQMSTG